MIDAHQTVSHMLQSNKKNIFNCHIKSNLIFIFLKIYIKTVIAVDCYVINGKKNKINLLNR